MTDIDPRLKNLIMDTTAGVLKETGLHKVPFEDLAPEQVYMPCERMGFEVNEIGGNRYPEKRAMNWLNELLTYLTTFPFPFRIMM